MLPCRRLWLDSSPNASHLLRGGGWGAPPNPPMSWLQKPKPDSPRDSPPRRLSAIDSKVEVLSPPQCTGNCCPPTVAERANTTAPGSPLRSLSSSKTVLLYRY